MAKKSEVITVRPNTLTSQSAQSLGINEQRILFYSIFKIQENTNTVSFTKSEMEERFDVDLGSYKDIKKYLLELRSFGTDIQDEKSEKITVINAFSHLTYDNGLFSFRFNKEFLPAINKQKRFLLFGMKSIDKFRSKYSVYLYNFLKDRMFGDISSIRNIGLSEFKAIFKLEDDVYKGRNANFKARVWQPAMEEVNLYSDYHIEILTKGRGDNITYTIIRTENEDLSGGKKNKEFVCGLGKEIVDIGCHDCMKINKCPFPVKEIGSYPWDKDNITMNELYDFMSFQLWNNPHYSVYKRVKNHTNSELETIYYNYVLAQSNMDKITEENIENLFNEDRDRYENRFVYAQEDFD